MFLTKLGLLFFPENKQKNVEEEFNHSYEICLMECIYSFVCSESKGFNLDAVKEIAARYGKTIQQVCMTKLIRNISAIEIAKWSFPVLNATPEGTDLHGGILLQLSNTTTTTTTITTATGVLLSGKKECSSCA